MNKIIAIVGLCGSGKSVSADILSLKNFERISINTLIERELLKKNIDNTEINRKFMRNELRILYGKDALVSLLFEDIDKILENNNLIFEGLYSWNEYLSLKKKYADNLIIVNIFSPKEIRYDRLGSRVLRPLNKENIIERDNSEIESLNKGGPIAISDYVIINDGTKEDLSNSIERFLLTFNLR